MSSNFAMAALRTRRGRLIASAAAATLAAGSALALIPGTSSAGADTVTATVPVTCSVKGLNITLALSAQVSATLPLTATPGATVSATNVTTTMSLPANLISTLESLDATTVSGAIETDAVVAGPSSTGAQFVFGKGSVPSTSFPSSGDLTVTSQAASSQFAVGAAGTNTVTAAKIVITVSPKTASGGSTLVGNLTVNCATVSGQNTKLASIAVAAARTPTPTPTPTVAPTAVPTTAPTAVPTSVPTSAPPTAPKPTPTTAPTVAPTSVPSAAPTTAPTIAPTSAPTPTPNAGKNPYAGHYNLTFTGLVSAPDISMPLHMPITGTTSLTVSNTGAVTGSVSIPAVTVNETVEGVVPISERIQLTVGAVTGSYPVGGPLSLTLPIKVSVPFATVFGFLPVILPIQNCSTGYNAVTLTGVGNSLNLSGSMTMSSFSGCGLVSSYVNDIAGAQTNVSISLK